MYFFFLEIANCVYKLLNFMIFPMFVNVGNPPGVCETVTFLFTGLSFSFLTGKMKIVQN